MTGGAHLAPGSEHKAESVGTGLQNLIETGPESGLDTSGAAEKVTAVNAQGGIAQACNKPLHPTLAIITRSNLAAMEWPG